MKVDEIIKICNIASGVDIRNKSREKEYVYGRSVFYNLVKTYHPKMSYVSIGKIVNVTHASILFSMNQSKYVYITDPVYVTIYNKATELINVKSDVKYKDDYIKELEFYIPDGIISYINNLKSKINNLSLENHRLSSLIQQMEKDKENNKSMINYLDCIPQNKLPEFVETRVVPYMKMLKLDKTYETKRIITE
jgi:hypothetical protein